MGALPISVTVGSRSSLDGEDVTSARIAEKGAASMGFTAENRSSLEDEGVSSGSVVMGGVPISSTAGNLSSVEPKTLKR